MFGLSSVHNYVSRNGRADPLRFWFKLTGEENAKSSKLYISHVQHPVFPIFLKFIANCVLGRPNNHLTRLVNLTVLAHSCQPQCLLNDYLPKAIIKNLLSTISGTTAIVCGGLVTHIASKLPVLSFQDTDEVSDSALVSIPFLKNAHDLQLHAEDRNGVKSYQWRLHPTQSYPGLVLLPSPGFNDHLACRSHDCIPGVIPDTITAHLRREERRRQGLPFEEEESEEEEQGEGDEHFSEGAEGAGPSHPEPIRETTAVPSPPQRSPQSQPFPSPQQRFPMPPPSPAHSAHHIPTPPPDPMHPKPIWTRALMQS